MCPGALLVYVSPQLVNICNDYDAPPFLSCGQGPPGGPKIPVWPFNLSSLWWCTNRERPTARATFSICRLFRPQTFGAAASAETAQMWDSWLPTLLEENNEGNDRRQETLSQTHNISLTIQKKKKKRNRERKSYSWSIDGYPSSFLIEAVCSFSPYKISPYI